MFIKKRFISRPDWKRILTREYSEKIVSLGDMRAAVGVLRIGGVSEPFRADVCGRTMVLADRGYTWVELLPDGRNWCLTAMYDPSGSMLQFYFDVTKRNVTDAPAHFFDLFLDVTVDPDGRAKLLDADELGEALTEGIISQAEYDLAQHEADAILAAFPSQTERLDRICRALAGF